MANEMMGFIWGPEVIGKLLLHSSSDVQLWAIDKALKLYPNILCDQVLALIPSAPADISQAILHRTAELDLPLTHVELLIEITRGDVETDLKALAGAILLRSGYALLPHEVELASATTYASVVASTEQGFNIVLQAYRECSEENESILDGIADVLNFADLYHNLADTEPEKEIKKSIDYFCQLWKRDIPLPKQLSQPEHILSLLNQSLVCPAPEDSTPWKQGLLTELEYERAQLGAVRDIAKERVSRWPIEEKKFLLSCVLCLWRNEICRRRLVEAKGIAELWGALVIKPWRGVPGQALKDFLLSISPGELLNSLSEALHCEYSYASYAFSILNALDTPGRSEFFLDVYKGKEYGDTLAEEAGEALRKAGAPAIEFIIEHYAEMSEDLRILVLFVLDSFPTQQVVDFCLEHFSEYMCSSALDDFIGCLEEIASIHFLPPLLQEWKEGEVEMGRAIELISEIHDIRDKQIDRIIQDTEKMTRHIEDVLDKPITSFPLRCTKCKYTYHYALNSVYMDKHGNVLIGDIIQCKGCGSIETYEITAQAQFGFTAELLRLAAVRETQPEKALDSLDTPLKLIQRVHMRALGRRVKSTDEAYHLIKDEIEKHPLDADLQRRMGNLLRNGGRPDLALPYYLEALRLNPNDTESCYFIADILIEQKQYKEAISYLERLVPLCRESRMNEDLRRAMFAALLNQAYIIEKETGHKVEVFRLAKPEEMEQAKEPFTIALQSFDLSIQEDFEWLYYTFRYGRTPQRPVEPIITLEATRANEIKQSPVVRGMKIGRNDPCPCGSGKKYKKCCGC